MKNLTLLLSIASLALFVACKKKDSGGGVADPGVNLTGQACSYNQVAPAGYSCTNGVLVPIGVNNNLGTGNLLNNVQMRSSYFQGILSVSGSATGYAANLSDPRLINQYAGQITIQGSVSVVNQTLCGAPVGTYQVQGSGMVTNTVLGNTMLNLTGPSNMQIMIYSGSFSDLSGMGLNRDSTSKINVTFAQLVVNGMPCGSITTY